MRPFAKIGVDLCSYGNQEYLIVVDYFSKWLEIIPVKDKTIVTCIKVLKNLFSTYGNFIVTDNVPFKSHKYRQFANEYGFEPLFISSKHSQSSGMVEKAVHIAKLFFFLICRRWD